MASYRVLRGLNYRGKRREAGSKVDDLTAAEVKDLRARGAIEPLKKTKGSKD